MEAIPGRKRGKPWRPTFRFADTTPFFVSITAANTRASDVDAMLFAAENQDKILGLIGPSADRTEAHKKLVSKCGLSLRQADVVLEMRAYHWTRKFRQELEGELRKTVNPAGKRALGNTQTFCDENLVVWAASPLLSTDQH